MPLTSFSENEKAVDGSYPPVWFALAGDRPLTYFSGIRVEGWASVRKVKDGETTDDLFAFLTTEPEAVVGVVHPKVMPVILTKPEEWATWLSASWPEARSVQRPLADGALIVIARSLQREG